MRTKGFTLAEVLVTLMIIGIITVMVIPSLISSIQNYLFKAAYKNAFGDINQAYVAARREDAIKDNLASEVQDHYVNFSALRDQMKVLYRCDSSTDLPKCWVCDTNDLTVKPFTSCFKNSSNAFIDSQGRSWWNVYRDQNFIEVDVNGLKAPNIFGKDRFLFGLKDKNAKTFDTVYTGIRPYWEQDPINPSDICPLGKCYFKSWLGL